MITEYGQAVKIELIKRHMTVADLCAAVEKDTGMYIDYSYISKICRGKRHPETIINSINKILQLNTTT